MARPRISDDIRDELRRRYLDGENISALAPELGVSISAATVMTRDIRYSRGNGRGKRCTTPGCRRVASTRAHHHGLCQQCDLEGRCDRESPSVLTGGKWVPSKWGVLRWVPNIRSTR